MTLQGKEPSLRTHSPGSTRPGVATIPLTKKRARKLTLLSLSANLQCIWHVNTKRKQIRIGKVRWINFAGAMLFGEQLLRLLHRLKNRRIN